MAMAITTVDTSQAQAPATAQALTPLQRKFATMKQMLETNNVAKQIELALPRAIAPQRFLRIALTELRTNPQLLSCTPESVVGSIIQAAQLGLEVDRVLGQGYLISYKNTDTNPPTYECQFQPGYRGYIQLSRRSGEIKSLGAHVVHAGEPFEYEQGTEPYLRHRPNDDQEDQPVTHVYAVVHYTNGGFDFEVMTAKAVAKVRAMSKAPNSPAWKQSFDEMAKAKVLRRLSKRLPVSAENASLVKAAVLDEMADAGVPQNNSTLLEMKDGVPYVTQPTQAIGHDQGLASKSEGNLDAILDRHAPQNGMQPRETSCNGKG
jgi:recombination protein RecT